MKRLRYIFLFWDKEFYIILVVVEYALLGTKPSGSLFGDFAGLRVIQNYKE